MNTCTVVDSENQGMNGDGHGAAITIRKAVHTATIALSITLLLSANPCSAIAQQSNQSVTAIESLIRSGQHEQALQATSSALKTRPSDFRLWTLQGIIYSMQGKDQDAKSAFERALRISPQYAPALRGEVQILY